MATERDPQRERMDREFQSMVKTIGSGISKNNKLIETQSESLAVLLQEVINLKNITENAKTSTKEKKEKKEKEPKKESKPKFREDEAPDLSEHFDEQNEALGGIGDELEENNKAFREFLDEQRERKKQDTEEDEKKTDILDKLFGDSPILQWIKNKNVTKKVIEEQEKYAEQSVKQLQDKMASGEFESTTFFEKEKEDIESGTKEILDNLYDAFDEGRITQVQLQERYTELEANRLSQLEALQEKFNTGGYKTAEYFQKELKLIDDTLAENVATVKTAAKKSLAKMVGYTVGLSDASETQIDKDELKGGLKAQHFAEGGVVKGPKGVDTVPAMLSPGEGVLTSDGIGSVIDLLNNGPQKKDPIKDRLLKLEYKHALIRDKQLTSGLDKKANLAADGSELGDLQEKFDLLLENTEKPFTPEEYEQQQFQTEIAYEAEEEWRADTQELWKDILEEIRSLSRLTAKIEKKSGEDSGGGGLLDMLPGFGRGRRGKGKNRRDRDEDDDRDRKKDKDRDEEDKKKDKDADEADKKEKSRSRNRKVAGAAAATAALGAGGLMLFSDGSDQTSVQDIATQEAAEKGSEKATEKVVEKKATDKAAEEATEKVAKKATAKAASTALKATGIGAIIATIGDLAMGAGDKERIQEMEAQRTGKPIAEVQKGEVKGEQKLSAGVAGTVGGTIDLVGSLFGADVGAEKGIYEGIRSFQETMDQVPVLGDAINATMAVAGDALGAVGPGITTALGGVVDGVKGVGKGFVDGFDKVMTGDVLGGLGEAGMGLVKGAGDMVSGVFDGAGQILTDSTAMINDYVEEIPLVGKAVGQLVEDVGKGVGGVADGIGDLFQGEFTEGFSKMGEGLLDTGKGLLMAPVNLVENLYDDVKSGITAVADFFEDPMGNTEQMLDTAQKNATEMWNSFSGTLSDVGEGITQGAEAVGQFASDTWNSVSEGVSSAAESVGGFFSDIGSGIADFFGFGDEPETIAKPVAPTGLNSGGIVPGSPGENKDTVPTMLTPGEGVINKSGMASLDQFFSDPAGSITGSLEPAIAGAASSLSKVADIGSAAMLEMKKHLFDTMPDFNKLLSTKAISEVGAEDRIAQSKSETSKKGDTINNYINGGGGGVAPSHNLATSSLKNLEVAELSAIARTY